MAPVRLLIVDIHPAFAQGLQLLLSADPEIAAIATSSNPGNVIDLVVNWRPDVVLMSIEPGGINGITILSELRALAQPPPVITFTEETDNTTPVRAMEAGAVGFLTKDLPAEEVIAAIKVISRGGTWIPARMLGTLVKRLRASGAADEDECGVLIRRLTARELEVLRLMVSGLDRGAISARLYRSPNTVRTHIGAIMAKMDAHSTGEVVAIALRAGMRPESPAAASSSDRRPGTSSVATFALRIPVALN